MLVRPLRGLLFLVLFASIVLAVGSPLVHADGLFVNSPSGLPGTTFQIQGGGFSANEVVQLWS
jgi:hypothetical protein